MTYKLIERFCGLFEGQIYRHRASTNGDSVAVELFEDLLDLGRSSTFVARANSGSRVVSTKNLVTGRESRRGDGSFGELLPNLHPSTVDDFQVARGPIANIEIGVETKILAKAMIKQIDRVMSDLENQARVFRSAGGSPICIAVVGINQATEYLSYEGDRTFLTEGTSGYRHPSQECAEAERRIRQRISSIYDELIVLPFVATNQPGHNFRWVDEQSVSNSYGASLIRISQEYDRIFK